MVNITVEGPGTCPVCERERILTRWGRQEIATCVSCALREALPHEDYDFLLEELDD